MFKLNALMKTIYVSRDKLATFCKTLTIFKSVIKSDQNIPSFCLRRRRV